MLRKQKFILTADSPYTSHLPSLKASSPHNIVWKLRDNTPQKDRPRRRPMHCLLKHHQQMSYRTFDRIQYNRFCAAPQSHSRSPGAVLPELQDCSSRAGTRNRPSLTNIQKPPTSSTSEKVRTAGTRYFSIKIPLLPYGIASSN